LLSSIYLCHYEIVENLLILGIIALLESKYKTLLTRNQSYVKYNLKDWDLYNLGYHDLQFQSQGIKASVGIMLRKINLKKLN